MEEGSAKVIPAPVRIEAKGNQLKSIVEFVGRWIFDTVVLIIARMLRIKTREETLDLHEGQAVIAKAGEWVHYSISNEEGAEYIAVCLPVFTPEMVRLDS